MRRVVQWTTGRTGRAAARAVLAHPHLELVGCYAWSPDKVGTDVGELLKSEPVGVAATDDIAALLALAPDCVVYTPYRPDVDHVVRILESGVNVATTINQLIGEGPADPGVARIRDAARAGGASLYASGIYPGHVPLLALASTAVSKRIDCISILESVDLTSYPSAEMYRGMGIDRDPTDPEAAALIEQSCASFRSQVGVMAHALDVELDEIVFRAEFAVAPEDLDFGFMTVGKGRVAAIRGTIAGCVGGRSRIECRSVWKMGERTDPDWPVEHGYVIEVEGDPSYRCRIEPGDGWGGASSTAVPVVQAIPALCDAAPGIVNYAELPFVRGFIR